MKATSLNLPAVVVNRQTRVSSVVLEAAIWLVGLVLVAAAALKIAAVSSGGGQEAGLGSGMNLSLAAGETLLATWLVSGIRRFNALSVGLLTFVGFAVYSCVLMLNGASSCGCFGELVVPPRLTLAVDLFCASVLGLNTGLRPHSGLMRPVQAWVAVALLGTILGAGVTLCSGFAMGSTVDLGKISGVTFLNPHEWAGRRFPLHSVLEGDFDASSGNWIVILSRSGCADCTREMQRVPGLAGAYAEQGWKLGVVQVDRGAAHYRRESPGFAGYAKLIQDRSWFVKTPAVVAVVDGVVRSCFGALPDPARLDF